RRSRVDSHERAARVGSRSGGPRGEVADEQRGRPRAVEVERDRLGPEREQLADRGRERAAVEAVGLEHTDRAEAREALRAARLLVLAAVGERDDERRDAGAQEVERRVVAALAHGRGRRAELRREVGDGAADLEAGAALGGGAEQLPLGLGQERPGDEPTSIPASASSSRWASTAATISAAP